MMLAQQLDSTIHLPNQPFIVQPKLDGARYMLDRTEGRARLINRNGLDKSEQYPEIIAEATTIREGVRLDGEIVVLVKIDPCTTDDFFYTDDFGRLQSREHLGDKDKIRRASKFSEATFIAFDVINDGSLTDRLLDLTEIVGTGTAHIKRINTLLVSDKSEIDTLFEKARSLKKEGIMIKYPDSRYENRRSESWLKLKTLQEQDFKVVGYTSHLRDISSLILDEGSHVNFSKADYTELIKAQKVSREVKTAEGMEYYFTEPYLITAKVQFLSKKYHARFPVLKELVKVGEAEVS
jgi:ATP-dependent DNA ligase